MLVLRIMEWRNLQDKSVLIFVLVNASRSCLTLCQRLSHAFTSLGLLPQKIDDQEKIENKMNVGKGSEKKRRNACYLRPTELGGARSSLKLVLEFAGHLI